MTDTKITLAMTTQKRKMGERVSFQQKEALVTFMEANPAVAKNQWVDITIIINLSHHKYVRIIIYYRFVAENGAKILEKKWTELANHLNALGGAFKNNVQWKKCWDDIKAAVKKRTTAMRSEYLKSGINGTNPIKKLEDHSQRVLSIITIDSVDGDGESIESGAPHIRNV